jgi:hypothetical protein
MDLPRLNNDDKDRRALWIDDVSPAEGVDWAQHCDRLADDGRFNHVKHGMLLSTAMMSDLATRPTRLFLLRLRWKSVLGRTGVRIPDSTLGVAALSGTTLRMLRVQDHVRRLGLGAEFMRQLIEREQIDEVDIRGGHYGLVGVCRNRTAREIAEHLEALRLRALKRKRARNDAKRGARIARAAREGTAEDVSDDFSDDVADDRRDA